MADHSGRRIRAVILDLDGTLLTSAGDVTVATRKALTRLVASGIRVVAATARAPRGVYGVVPEIPWAVCCNGAIIYDVAERTIRWERTFEPTAAVEIIRAVREAVPDVGFAARAGDALVCNSRYSQERPGPLPAGSRIIERTDDLGVLAERQGWTPQEAVAFGDMPNDLDLFDWAGLTVAVANAHPDIRAAADMVTASNDDDGVLQALRELQLVETPRDE